MLYGSHLHINDHVENQNNCWEWRHCAAGDTGDYLTSRFSQTANGSSGTMTAQSTVHFKVHLMCHSPKLIYLWGQLGNKHK